MISCLIGLKTGAQSLFYKNNKNRKLKQIKKDLLSHVSKTVQKHPGTYFEHCSRPIFELNPMNQIHGLKDHAKVNILAKTKYPGTFSCEQNQSAKLQSFADFQKTKSTLHCQIPNLAKTKIVLESMGNINHTLKIDLAISKIKFFVSFNQTLGNRFQN